MKNYSQKFIGILALVFAISFAVNAQEVGEIYEGGYIFQINDDGSGLVADLEDLGSMAWQPAKSAAMNSTSQGYNDWFMPSKPQLQLMYSTIGQGSSNIGGFINEWYWSSTQTGGNSLAWVVGFFNGSNGYKDMNTSVYPIRAVRAVTFETEVLDCTDASAVNFNPNATVDDGSCEYAGCTDASASNYDASANTNDGSCVIEGCTDSLDYHFSPDANVDNGTCTRQFPINFEIDTVGHRWPGDFNNTLSYVISNPDPDDTNYSSNVIEHTWIGPYFYTWQGTLIPVEPINFSLNGSVFTLDVYTSNTNTPVLLKLEAPDGSSIEQLQLTNTSNNWEQLTYDFGDSLTDNLYTKVVLFFEFSPEQFGNEIGTSTFYFDNINQLNDQEVLLDLLESQISTLQANLDAAMANQEDGVSLADVDAAYAEGAASVEVPECEEVDTQNIPLELLQGWNMIGYTCVESKDVVYAFSEISDKIEIVKDAWGLAYLPAWGFSAFDNLEYGKGYQVKMNEEVTDFQFCSTVVLASEDNEPPISIGYGTYSILSWTNDGEDGLPSESSAYMNINSDAILTIDVVASFPDEQGQFVDIYNSLPANYESDFTDTIYITPLGEEAFSLLISSNENSIYLSGTDNYGSNIMIEITPVTTIHGCMDPNNPSYNSSANKNDNSCLEGCFDTNACNYGEEGATECTYPVNECDCEGNGPDYANASFQINLNDGGFDGINNVELTVNLWEGVSEMIIGLEDNNGDGIWEGNFDGAQGAIFDFVINVNGSEQTTLSDCEGNSFVNGFPNPVADGLDVCNVWNNTIELNPFDCPQPQIQIGDQHAGGIVFYIDETGEHGLVAAIQDLEETYQWGCSGTSISGADGESIGTGFQNTLDIASGCSETPIAASEALAYESEGYSDWFLPSKDELLEMYNTIGHGGSQGNIGGFENTWYWSSSETNYIFAWFVYFQSGVVDLSGYKNYTGRVRVIRAF
jgi:hypothetical protein